MSWRQALGLCGPPEHMPVSSNALETQLTQLRESPASQAAKCWGMPPPEMDESIAAPRNLTWLFNAAPRPPATTEETTTPRPSSMPPAAMVAIGCARRNGRAGVGGLVSWTRMQSEKCSQKAPRSLPLQLGCCSRAAERSSRGWRAGALPWWPPCGLGAGPECHQRGRPGGLLGNEGRAKGKALRLPERDLSKRCLSRASCVGGTPHPRTLPSGIGTGAWSSQ
jgi:hypothetical protein